MLRLFLVVIILLFLSNQVEIWAQPIFENKTRIYKKNIPTRSVIPGGMLDLDGDLVDDLVIIDKGLWLKPVISLGKNFGLRLIDSLKLASNSEITLTAGDINNDGTQEIITSGEFSRINVSYFKDNKITTSSLPSGIYAQGSNTVDINNDGWLDYFLCNDTGPNMIYINDKKGNLALTPVIDFMKNDTTDGSGNYGSVWTDVNGDFKPDLYISKCRAGVNDPQDLRRINRLYINKGNGTFEEKAGIFNLDSGDQSWVTTFGDIDNDGDQDAYLVNHYSPHILYQNLDNKTFERIPVSKPLQLFGFQVVMCDLDNDALLDIIIAGVEGVTILHNKGNRSFETITGSIGPNLPRSITLGDINDDGFIDISAHINEPINLVGLKDDELWLNHPNGNHFLKVNLEGKASNRSAIGSHLTLYTPGTKQVRYVKGGESFGIFNSLQQHFGLGKSEIIDSLVIRWPSGLKEVYKNLKADHTYFAQEGSCMSQQLSLYTDELILKGNSLTISAPGGETSYLWNNGSTSRDITVSKPEKYFVKMINSLGCVTISKPINVVSGCFLSNQKLINEPPAIKICQGDIIEVLSSKAASYLWSNGKTTPSIMVNTSGSYTLKATDYCGNVLTDTIKVEAQSIKWNLKGDTVRKGEKATLTSDSKSTFWYSKSDLTTPFFIGDTLITQNLETTTSFYARVKGIIDAKNGRVGEQNLPVGDIYGANSTAGGMVFNVQKPCTIRSVKVSTDTKGKRRIVILDKTGKQIFSKEIFLEIGTNRVVLDANMLAGEQFRMVTDENVNTLELGFKSPRLVRTFNNTAYPYELNGVITIASSVFGAVYYYYFYDWEVEYDHLECQSEIIEVVASVEKIEGVQDGDILSSFAVFPNPASEELTIKSSDAIKITHFNIVDCLGNQWVIGDIIDRHLNISNIPSGIYILNIFTMQGNKSLRFIKK
jgi:hypothetical protein